MGARGNSVVQLQVRKHENTSESSQVARNGLTRQRLSNRPKEGVLACHHDDAEEYACQADLRNSHILGTTNGTATRWTLQLGRKMRGKLKKRPQVWSSGPQGMSAGRRTQKRRRAAALQSGQDAEIVRTRGAAMLRPYEVRGKAGQGEALKARALSAWVLRGIKERERLGAVRLRIHGCETSSRWVISTPSWASAKSVQRTMPCPVTLR